MNEVKISMIGVSGSGKTAFLSGICDTFISGNIEACDSKNDDKINKIGYNKSQQELLKIK